MADQADDERLKALEARIAAAKAAVEGPRKAESSGHRQAQLAWRMVIELVAGLGIGFGIGYGLDSLFGTMPIFLVLFIFVGLAAGVKTMLQSAREAQFRIDAEQDKAKAAAAADGEGDDGRGRAGA